jgi:hypothetical protein
MCSLMNKNALLAMKEVLTLLDGAVLQLHAQQLTPAVGAMVYRSGGDKKFIRCVIVFSVMNACSLFVSIGLQLCSYALLVLTNDYLQQLLALLIF